jgi:hypothetical protein
VATNAIGSEKVCGLSCHGLSSYVEDAAGVVQAFVEGAADELELVRLHFDGMPTTIEAWKPGSGSRPLLPANTP